MNRAILLGRLTKDPDVRRSQGAEPVTIARYTLAVDRRSKKQEGQQADFISCVAFGKAGEFAEKYLHKGTKICVSGHIQTGSYTRQDGTGQQGSWEQSAMEGFMNIPDGIDEELPFN